MKSFLRLLLLLLLLSLAIGQSATQDTYIPLELVIADFEQGLPFATSADGNNIGFVPWGDTHENVRLSATQVIPYSSLSLPVAPEAANTVLTVTYDIASWGGFTHVFTDGSTWISADWRDYNALSLWVYGTETGLPLQFEIFDNRNAEISGDSAERFFFRLMDDFAGWQQITIPFRRFLRRIDWQPEGAPNDGLGLDAVSGYAIGFPVGTGQIHIDNVGLVTVENTSRLITSRQTEEEAIMVDNSITWDSREWNLIWSDEFDGEAGTPIDDSKWTHELGGSGWGNNELEFYTNLPENASLDGNGNLAIVARVDDSGSRACHYGLCQYTSARLVTRDKFEFTYGRVEARLRIPRGQGIWPAFWMLGENITQVGWPASGEIDIMENIGREPQTVHGTLHGPGYSGADNIGRPYNIDEDFADDFHVYAVDWDENAIRWYVDGNLYSILTPNDLRGNEWVYDHDFFILLNVAVGGHWPGMPDDTTIFPQTMLVDYVRVYQLAVNE
jgi:beta-glucanase (GH16 family)